MLKLKIGRQPEWVDLGDGVEVLVRPVTTALITQAREIAVLEQDASLDHRVVSLTAAVAQIAIIDWRGVAAEDGETLAIVSPEAIAALMEIYPVSVAFYDRCVAPALMVVSEKNVSSPARNGVSAGATITADTAPADAKPAQGETTSQKPSKAG